MKIKLSKKQITWGITAFLVILAVLVLYALVYRSGTVSRTIRTLIGSMRTVVYGAVIAYILSSVVNFIEDKLLMPLFARAKITPHPVSNKKHFYRMRAVSVLLTMLFVAFLFYLLIALIVPQLIDSVREIMINFPDSVNNVYRYVNTLFTEQPELRRTFLYVTSTYSTRINTFFDTTLMPFLTSTVQGIPRIVADAAIRIFNFFIGFIVSVYVLYSKESFCAHAKKMAYAFFKEKWANEIVGAFRYVHMTFTGFITGKLADSMIVGVICYVAVLIMRLPYPVLIAVIVGITNLIPFFGPYIGGIAGALLLVLIRPLYAVLFLIFVIILQLVDGNIIGPKILGNTTGLSSFWVIFSIVFFGALFGVAGWLIGVPLFAVFYAFVRRLTVRKLEKRGLKTETDCYTDLAYVEHGVYKKLGDADVVKYGAAEPPSNWKKLFQKKKE